MVRLAGFDHPAVRVVERVGDHPPGGGVGRGGLVLPQLQHPVVDLHVGAVRPVFPQRRSGDRGRVRAGDGVRELLALVAGCLVTGDNHRGEAAERVVGLGGGLAVRVGDGQRQLTALVQGGGRDPAQRVRDRDPGGELGGGAGGVGGGVGGAGPGGAAGPGGGGRDRGGDPAERVVAGGRHRLPGLVSAAGPGDGALGAGDQAAGVGQGAQGPHRGQGGGRVVVEGAGSGDDVAGCSGGARSVRVRAGDGGDLVGVAGHHRVPGWRGRVGGRGAGLGGPERGGVDGGDKAVTVVVGIDLRSAPGAASEQVHGAALGGGEHVGGQVGQAAGLGLVGGLVVGPRPGDLLADDRPAGDRVGIGFQDLSGEPLMIGIRVPDGVADLHGPSRG